MWGYRESISRCYAFVLHHNTELFQDLENKQNIFLDDKNTNEDKINLPEIYSFGFYNVPSQLHLSHWASCESQFQITVRLPVYSPCLTHTCLPARTHTHTHLKRPFWGWDNAYVSNQPLCTILLAHGLQTSRSSRGMGEVFGSVATSGLQYWAVGNTLHFPLSYAPLYSHTVSDIIHIYTHANMNNHIRIKRDKFPTRQNRNKQELRTVMKNGLLLLATLHVSIFLIKQNR